jgi:hypothetical protein
MRASQQYRLVEARMSAQIIARATRDDGDARAGQACKLMEDIEGAWQEARLFRAWRQRR